MNKTESISLVDSAETSVSDAREITSGVKQGDPIEILTDAVQSLALVVRSLVGPPVTQAAK